MKKIFLVMILLAGLCIGPATAWAVDSEDYTGTINFFNDGTAIATIDGYPQTEFAWAPMAVQPTDGHYLYEATYLWYRVQFEYDPTLNVITSPQFPGARLV